MEDVLTRDNDSWLALLRKQCASRTGALQLLLIVLAALLVNGNTLFNGFVYDDHWQILENPWVRDFRFIPDIFSNDATHVEMGGSSNYYRPLMNISYLLTNYLFHGLKPWGFHLVNVLTHVCVTVMVFVTAALLERDTDGHRTGLFLSFPLVAALIFAVHPIHTEVIAWVACVPELTFTLCCLLAFCFHMTSRRDFDRWHLWSLAAFGVAVFSKETAVTLLPILVLYDLLYRVRRVDLRGFVMRYAPFVLPIVLYAALRFRALGGMAPLVRHPDLSTLDLIINTLPLFAQYLGKLLLPIHLNAFYVFHPVHALTDPRWLVSFLAAIIFAALCIASWKKEGKVFLGLMLVALPLLPVLYIRGLGENTFAERYLYFPSVGFALLAGSFFTADWLKRAGMKHVPAMLLVAVLGAYAFGTVRRNEVWHDDLVLFGDTVRKSPDGAIPQHNLSLALKREKRYAEAIEHLQRTIALEPRFDTAFIDLAQSYAGIGQRDRAIETLLQALHLHPSSPKLHNELGAFLLDKGMVQDAVTEFQAAVILNRNLAPAYRNLGEAYALLGMGDKALENFEAAVRLEPANPAYRNNLDQALRNFGKR